MASLRSLAISLLRLDGHSNIAAANRHHARDPRPRRNAIVIARALHTRRKTAQPQIPVPQPPTVAASGNLQT